MSIGDIHNPLASTAPGVSPGSTADIGALGGPIDQGIEDIGNIGHGASGIIPNLIVPHDDLPVGIELPPTSAINPMVPPWQDQSPSQTPAPQTTSSTQVWPGRTVEIGVQQPWPGTPRTG